MIIGILTVDLHLPEATSLKQKRMVLKSMKDRVRRAFNVSVAEVDNHDKWQVARIGIAAIGRDKGTVNSLLDKVLNFLSTCNGAEVCDHELELI
jgi:uncharacterized protein YlxP (DUF503 family)